MRRTLSWILAACVVASGFVAFGFVDKASLEAQTVEANVADLQQQLESGLKVRRPEEFAFIGKVVTMVGNDTLPLDLVISTFLWTRKNPKAREYPFVYFQRALRERAKKLGIDV